MQASQYGHTESSKINKFHWISLRLSNTVMEECGDRQFELIVGHIKQGNKQEARRREGNAAISKQEG